MKVDILGCVCFGWKSLLEMLFWNEAVWLVRKILFFENWNPLTQKISLWPRKCFYTSIFPSKHFRKMREREREHARARGEDPVRDRELQLQSDGEIAIALSIAIRRDRDLGSRSRSDRDVAISDRDRAVDRDRSVIAILCCDRWWFFFLGCGLCFLICVFLLLFQTPENFFRKIFWNATKHMETFSFSGN